MGTYKPSGDFVQRTMEEIRSFETAMSRKRERSDAFLRSKPVLCALSAGGVLLGILNLVRMALILISPAACL